VKIGEEVAIDETITPELKREGLMREVIRHVQSAPVPGPPKNARASSAAAPTPSPALVRPDMAAGADVVAVVFEDM